MTTGYRVHDDRPQLASLSRPDIRQERIDIDAQPVRLLAKLISRTQNMVRRDSRFARRFVDPDDIARHLVGILRRLDRRIQRK
jgi:hypothetical protein